MTVEYDYADTDFLNDVCNEDRFTAEIAADETITTDLDYIRSSEDLDTGDITVYVGFASSLSGGEETALDALVAAHTGAPPTQVIWHASSVLAECPHGAEATDPNWDELGGTVTTPDFFTDTPQNCKGRVVGMVKTNGTGAKLRLREDDDTPSGGYDVPDTSGEWQAMQWFTPDNATAGTHSYILEGQLPTSGATQLEVKYVAVSLLEFA
jgi:hypothetical protein